jgi:protein-S-isoprenylcysteine O-methyltransferase Ste14
MNPTKIVILLVCSVVIIFVSWKSLKNIKSHGFYRFFAFELILFLILYNSDYWFSNPFTIPHIISWIILLFSIIIVADGFYLLKRVGKPKRKIEDSPNLGFENTTNLVISGIYKYIRHPLYSSLLFLGWGAFLKNINEVGAVIVILISVFLTLTAEAEEKENVVNFGDEYSVYMKNSKMFIPYIF